MSERDNTTSVLLSFLLGGMVGAAVAVLYAPQPGDETRRKIRYLAEELGEKTTDGFKDIRHRAEESVHTVHHRAEDGLHNVRDRIEHIADSVKHQKDRVATAVDAGRKAYREEQAKIEES